MGGAMERPTDVINAARIRVAGVGGLGLVAMALVVAWGIPRIGMTLVVGFVLSTLLAAILVWRRREDGPMPSSGQHAGANTILAIDSAVRDPQRRDERGETGNGLVSAVPVISG